MLRTIWSVQELAEVEHMLLSVELIIEDESVDVELELGPNCEVAAIRGVVHDEKPVSLSSKSRNDSHAELIPVGMRGFAVGFDADAEDAEDWAKATVVRAEIITIIFM